MNMLEMVLVLFAVVLFTTVALNYNRLVWEQADYLINANKYLQSSHLIHSILDEVDAFLFSKQLKFNDIKKKYNTERNVTLQHAGGTYSISIHADDCDSLGVLLPEPKPNNLYALVTVETKTFGLRHPVTQQRVYTKTDLNIK